MAWRETISRNLHTGINEDKCGKIYEGGNPSAKGNENWQNEFRISKL